MARHPYSSAPRLFILFILVALVVVLFPSPITAQTVTAAIPTGAGPHGIAINPVTNKIYVASWSGETVTAIDGATNTTTTIEVGRVPQALAVNAVTNKV